MAFMLTVCVSWYVQSTDMAMRFSGTTLLGAKIEVTRTTREMHAAGSGGDSPGSAPRTPELPPAPASHTLVLKNLNRDMNTSKLEDYLHGLPITPVWVDRKAASGGKGAAVAFVRYKTAELATSVMEMIRGYDLHGRKIKVEYKRTKDRTRSRGGSEDFGGLSGTPTDPISIRAGRRRSRGLSMSSVGSDGSTSSWRERRLAAQLSAAAGGEELLSTSPSVKSGAAIRVAKGPQAGTKGFELSRSLGANDAAA